MPVKPWFLVVLLGCLIACSGPRVVKADDLFGRRAFYLGETPTSYRIRLEQWEVLSIDGIPRLRNVEEVEMLKNTIRKDSQLMVGDLLWIDGATLRPMRQVIKEHPVFTIPVPEFISP